MSAARSRCQCDERNVMSKERILPIGNYRFYLVGKELCVAEFKGTHWDLEVEGVYEILFNEVEKIQDSVSVMEKGIRDLIESYTNFPTETGVRTIDNSWIFNGVVNKLNRLLDS